MKGRLDHIGVGLIVRHAGDADHLLGLAFGNVGVFRGGFAVRRADQPV